MKKEPSTKEKIIEALKPRKKLKKSKFTVTKKIQEELNEMRKKIGLPEEEIKPEHDLEFYYG